MRKSILIVGLRSKLAKDITFQLKKKYEIKNVSFNNFIRLPYLKFKNYNFLINCSFNKNCLSKKCNSDMLICDKLKKNKSIIKFIMFSTGKVYGKTKSKEESLKCKPTTKYGKYRLKTENYLKKNLKKNLLILRISNVINFDIRQNSASKTVINTMLINLIKRKKIYIPSKKNYKDFITIDYFVKSINKLLENNLSGIYNISSNIKISLDEVAKRLIKGFKIGKIYTTRETTDNFVLKNDLITETVGIKINKKKILDFVEKIGVDLKKVKYKL